MCVFTIFTSETFWVFVTAVATILLAYIAYTQFGNLLAVNEQNAKAVAATFLNEFKEGFFTEQQRVLILLIEKKLLKFHKDEGIFENIAPKNLKLKFPEISFLQRKYYLTQEIDDYLLGHFEDAALLRNDGVITLEDAEQHFEYYLSTTLENEEIAMYIQWVQDEDHSDTYKRSQELYKEFNP
jgi:hypothetical protein